MQGRVSSVLKILSFDPCVVVGKISYDVINPLKQKNLSPILENTDLNGPVNELLPCSFDNFDEKIL